MASVATNATIVHVPVERVMNSMGLAPNHPNGAPIAIRRKGNAASAMSSHLARFTNACEGERKFDTLVNLNVDLCGFAD